MNAVTLPKPLAIDDKVVTFSRADWEAYRERLEDAEDAAAADRLDAQIATLGRDEVIRRGYTLAESERLTDGVSPLCIWRERAGLTQRRLAELAEVNQSYLAEIETGKKPGSAAALMRIAKVLDVPMEVLISGAAQG